MSAEFFSYIALTLVVLISICCLVLGFLLLKSRKASSPEPTIIEEEPLEEELESLKDGQSIEAETKALGDIRANLEAKVKQVSQLKDIVKEQIAGLLGAKKRAAESDNDGLDEKHVDQLIDQTEKSSEIITILKSEFEENIQKLAKQEELLAKKNLDIAKVRKLVSHYQKLKGMNKKLASEVVKLKKELQQQSTTNTAPTNSQTPITESSSELENSLARAIREKEFIESHYLELIESMPDAEKLKQELENTKKELSMLEEQVTVKA